MRSATLAILLLASLGVHSQTKESQFAKIDALLKKTKDFALPNFKIGIQVFSEKVSSLEGSTSESTDRMEYSLINWDEFDFDVDEVENAGEVSELVIYLRHDATVSSYSNGKLLDKSPYDELNFFFKTADTRAMKTYLEDLKAYTWKSLIPLRTADQASLIRYLKEKLTAALDYDDGEIKSIDACEITLQLSGEPEFVIPTKILNIHEDGDDDDFMVFCYGKNEARVKKRETDGWVYESVEHPDILLDFEGNESDAPAVRYAMRRLSGYCKK